MDRTGKAGRGGIGSLSRIRSAARGGNWRTSRGERQGQMAGRARTSFAVAALSLVGLRGIRGLSRRFGFREAGILDGDVDFDFGGGDFLSLVGAGGAGFDEKRIFQTLHFAEVVEVSLPGHLLVLDFARGLNPEDEARCGIEETIADVAIFGGELELAGGFAVNFFRADV